MAFEGLADKLANSFKRLRSKGKLSESDVKDAMREVRLALLEADVNYKVAKDFTNRVTERAIGSDVMASLTPGQMVVKIVNEELTNLMGGEQERVKFAAQPPTIIMMCGLQGAGKTTHAAKLAKLYKGQGHRPMLVACDIYRPAAIKQLQVVGAQAGVPVFEQGKDDPVKICQNAIRYAKDYGHDIVIIDTAGRLQIDEALMNELKRINEKVHPHEILLVVDSMTGQEAVNVAKTFDDLLSISGVILTKLDGDTRGGAALSVRAVTGKPIKFVGVGEKLDDLEVFHPDRMASRILGMGDVLSLIEKAQQNFDLKKAAELQEKMKKNRLTLTDFYDQLVQFKGMGSMQDLAGMLPGVDAKALEGADLDKNALGKTEAIILSMTPEERENPALLNSSRKKRIAAGSGTQVVDVNRLLKQFEMMQQMTRQMAGMSGGKMARKMARLGKMKGSFPF